MFFFGIFLCLSCREDARKDCRRKGMYQLVIVDDEDKIVEGC